MFSAVSINKSELTIGQIAEAMVYFGRTDLVMDRAAIKRLVQQVPHNTLLRLVDDGLLNLIYEADIPAVHSDGDRHFFSVMSFGDSFGIMPASSRISFENYYLRTFGITKANRARAEALANRIAFRDFDHEILRTLALRDALDVGYLQFIVDELLNAGNGTSARGTFFRALEVDERRIVVDTDYDFGLMESAGTSPANVLSHVLALNKEVLHSADGRTDLWLDPQQSRFLNHKISGFMTPIDRNFENIANFEAIVFEKLSIHAAIDSGRRNLDQLADVLTSAEAQKFKTWLSEQAPSRELITEYHRSVFSPEKGFGPLAGGAKVGVVVAAEVGLHVVLKMLGIEGTIELAAITSTALALKGAESAAEKLIASAQAGWRPNQWVEGPATDFVRGSEP